MRSAEEKVKVWTAVVLLSGAACVYCTPGGQSHNCAPATITLPVVPAPASGGGPGGQVVTPLPGGTGPSPGTASPAPSLVGGRLVLSDEQNRQTFIVPRGTIVEVDLVTRSYGPWSVPEGSDTKRLPRLSGSAACDGTATATFRADGSAQITAVRGNREVTDRYIVSIVVTS